MRNTRYLTCTVALAALLSLPALAQGTGPNSTSGSSNPGGTTASTTMLDDERGFNWGWLGLLGLVGLMGLRRHTDTHRSDTTRTPMPR